MVGGEGVGLQNEIERRINLHRRLVVAPRRLRESRVQAANGQLVVTTQLGDEVAVLHAKVCPQYEFGRYPEVAGNLRPDLSALSRR